MTTRQRNIFWTTVRMIVILVLIGVLVTHGKRHGEAHGNDDTSAVTNKDDKAKDATEETTAEQPDSEGQLSSTGTDPDHDADQADEKKESSDSVGTSGEEADDSTGTESKTSDRLAAVTIFVLAIFVGFEVITKVPPTLHTPLMSGSNAVSGITVVGAIIVAGQQGWLSSWLGMVAVALAMVNVVGGFLVTHRMLAMFKKR